DLSDSSMQRNIGTAFGHAVLAVENVRRGLDGLAADAGALARDLDAEPEVLAEAVQSVMRVHGLERPYERVSELTRGGRVDAAAIREFVRGLDLPDEVRDRLAALTPAGYTGLAARLVDLLEDGARGSRRRSHLWSSDVSISSRRASPPGHPPPPRPHGP